MRCIFFLLLIMISLEVHGTSEQTSTWQGRHAEGWAWYHDLQKKALIKKEDEKSKDPIAVLAVEKEELERALAKAMLEPSKGNILVYMKMQKKWTDQSSRFSKIWQLNALEHPELTPQTPTSQYGIKVKKEKEAVFNRSFIKGLAKGHILLFFYEGGNTFSHAFAKIVKEFSQDYGWAVKSISLDGLILRDYPKSIVDDGISKEMDVNQFPALFAVDMKTLKATPLAYGMVAVSQIEENIMMQFGEEHD